MDNEMIERVANIIHKYPYFTGKECEEIAIAAIRAMREPTNAMLASVPANWHSHRDIYARMIVSVINV